MTDDPHVDIGASRLLVPLTQGLRDLIRSRMERLQINGYRSLADRTGGEVSRAAVHRILTGKQHSVWPATLVILSRTLEIDDEDLAGVIGPAPSPWTLPETFNYVPARVRVRVERVLAEMLDIAGLLDPQIPPEESV